jgi:hypothetical protein
MIILYRANRRLGHNRRSAFKWAKIVVEDIKENVR